MLSNQRFNTSSTLLCSAPLFIRHMTFYTFFFKSLFQPDQLPSKMWVHIFGGPCVPACSWCFALYCLFVLPTTISLHNLGHSTSLLLEFYPDPFLLKRNIWCSIGFVLIMFTQIVLENDQIICCYSFGWWMNIGQGIRDNALGLIQNTILGSFHLWEQRDKGFQRRFMRMFQGLKALSYRLDRRGLYSLVREAEWWSY